MTSSKILIGVFALLLSACGGASNASNTGIEKSSPSSATAPDNASSSGASEAVARTPNAAVQPASPSKRSSSKKKEDPLFPKQKPRGWNDLKESERSDAHTVADAYVEFLSAAKTPRRAVAGLVKLAAKKGAKPAKLSDRKLTGTHYYETPNQDAAVFVRAGTAPLREGLSVVVVSVDAPRLILKASPIEVKYDHEMLQTDLHGKLDYPSWMVQPIALDVFAVKRGKPIAFSIGESADDPVLSIPDLLPHLSRGLQKRGKEVADPERLDAISASKAGGLARALRARRLTVADLASAETSLVPARPALRIGVDRAMIGGYGHKNRALAFAAIRGLLESTPKRSAVVIVVGQTEGGSGGESGYAFVGAAIRNAIAGLSEKDPDVFDFRIIINKTILLVGAGAGKKSAPNSGVFIDIGGADALPTAAREVISTMRSANVPITVRDRGWNRTARIIASGDLDVLGIEIPSSGTGSPGELLSVLDLYHGVRACRVWLSR